MPDRSLTEIEAEVREIVAAVINGREWTVTLRCPAGGGGVGVPANFITYGINGIDRSGETTERFFDLMVELVEAKQRDFGQRVSQIDIVISEGEIQFDYHCW